MAPYGSLYGRRCRMLVNWSELSENKIIGPELIYEAKNVVNLIRDRLKASSDCQNTYTNLKRRNIKYVVGDRVFLKVSPWKKILCFGHKGKLSPRFIGLYEIVERIEPIVYHLALPSELQKIHNIFHVSVNRSDPSQIVMVEEIEVQFDLTFEKSR